jgi:capsule polysaccharide export protein KpsE/RkpR
MGSGGLLGGLFGGGGGDTAGAAQRAAEKERLKIEREQAEKAARERLSATKSAGDAEAKRRAFAGQLNPQEDEEQRKRFLAGA